MNFEYLKFPLLSLLIWISIQILKYWNDIWLWGKIMKYFDRTEREPRHPNNISEYEIVVRNILFCPGVLCWLTKIFPGILKLILSGNGFGFYELIFSNISPCHAPKIKRSQPLNILSKNRDQINLTLFAFRNWYNKQTDICVTDLFESWLNICYSLAGGAQNVQIFKALRNAFIFV